MLKPKEVESYTGTLNDVVSDLIRRLEHQRSFHDQHVVKNVADEFYKFGLEGMCFVYHILCVTLVNCAAQSYIG